MSQSEPSFGATELETYAENFGLFLESLADGWIGELLVEIAIPCGFHLRLFSFAGVRVHSHTISP